MYIQKTRMLVDLFNKDSSSFEISLSKQRKCPAIDLNKSFSTYILCIATLPNHEA